jgi:hypothetical protein
MQASLQHKTHGQSIPLIAAMLVVLFGMVALAVDVGQTYAEQRNIVRGTNAASLAGMNRFLSGGTDADVRRAIEQSLIANGVPVAAYGQPPQPGQRVVKAEYWGANGELITSCPEVGACGTQKVPDVKYIRVYVDGKVVTFFARLFGATELPVSSYAFAKLGICQSGIFPIGIRTVVNGQPVFDDQGFKNNDGLYSDETYNDPALKYKKIYLHGISNSNGGFSFLRWDKDKQRSGNAGDLADMLAGAGNIGTSYTEVTPWPQVSEGPAQYDGYPLEPRSISERDWIYGSDFNSNNSPFTPAVEAQLEYHKTNRTLLTLPMYRYDNGKVDSPAYYLHGFGGFLLLDYGEEPGGKFFLTLASVTFNSGKCASLETNPPPSDKLVLAGNVEYLPRYRAENEADRPIRFLVVLDVTGSMNWTFDGQGTVNGTNVSCVDGEQTCNTAPNTGPKAAWGNEKERRIYIAKQVLKDFVDELSSNGRQYDMMRIVTFAGDFGDLVGPNAVPGNDVEAVRDLTKVLPENSWSNNPTVLKAAIDKAGDIGQGPYLMNGATSSAAGLARATQVFDQIPKPDTAPDGKQYRNVVIFMTDGVANVLRNGLLNNYNNCAAEAVACQAGIIDVGGQQMRAPLEAMVYEADKLTQEHVLPTGGKTYVVALGSNTDKTGLDAVATSGLAKRADQPGALKTIFDDMTQDAIYGQCREAVAAAPAKTMAASAVPVGSFPGLTTTVVGYVTLTNKDTNTTLPPVPIVASEPGRLLRYEARDLQPGEYTMKAWVGYNAPEDDPQPAPRLYNVFRDSLPPATEIAVTVKGSAVALNGVIPKNISLDLSGQVCATQPPTN